jgi:hypothetical protein
MADLKISELSAVTTPAASDVLPIVNSGSTKKVQRQHLFYGTQTNDSAAAGYIGEYISGALAFADRVSLTTATAKTVISISLTPGDWDVGGNVFFFPANTTNVTAFVASISAVDNGLDGSAGRQSARDFPSGGSAFGSPAFGTSMLTPLARISLATTTTIYLIARGDFSVSTMQAWGFISARRVR